MKQITSFLIIALTIAASSNAGAESMRSIQYKEQIANTSRTGPSAENILRNFATTNAGADLSQMTRVSRRTSGDFSFTRRTQRQYEGEFGFTLDGANLAVFARTDGETMPEIFINPVSPEGPDPLDGSTVLENPLPAAAPLLFAGLAALGFFSRRRRTT